MHPVLACFGDQDARVRYYACESMYNIAKVAKGEILPYFNELFDALCKLSADTDESVQKGADLLNRLIKDIVAEKAATYVSVVAEGPPEMIPAQVESSDPNQYVIANEPPQADKRSQQQLQHSNEHTRDIAFSLPKFIPLLMERIYVINPAARTFLVSWIVLLDSIPDLELVSYLPAFLGGLINFLNDQASGVRVATHAVLDNFLQEIRRITDIKKAVQENQARIALRQQIRRRNAETAANAAAAAAAAAAEARTLAAAHALENEAESHAESAEPNEKPQEADKEREIASIVDGKEPTEAPLLDRSATVDGSPLTAGSAPIDSPKSPSTRARNRSVSEQVSSIDAIAGPSSAQRTPTILPIKSKSASNLSVKAKISSAVTSPKPETALGIPDETVPSVNIEELETPQSAPAEAKDEEPVLSVVTAAPSIEVTESEGAAPVKSLYENSSGDVVALQSGAVSPIDSDELAIEEEDEYDDDEDEDNDNEGYYIPGQDVTIDFEKIIEILISHLDSSVEEIQIVVLRWIEAFLDISSESILPYGARFLSVLLPTMAYEGTDLRKAAEKVNQKLLGLIMSLPDTVDQQNSEENDSAGTGGLELETSKIDKQDDDVFAEPHKRLANLDYPAMVNALTLHFLDEKEETRVAAFDWLIMLHRKVPKRILAINDGTFPALLKTLSDPSEQVITRDLRLLAQISYNSDDEYFSVFMVNLLNLFSTDRRLLETRGNLIIRQLCLSLKPERIYWTLAEILEKEEEDLEFASLMVQYLNNILLTAPELSQLRTRMRNLHNKEGVSFFTALFRSWCHNPSAALTLCLLAQAYEYAFMLLQTIVEFEITIPLLVQIDKLVQLLESPVFTHLRLQLLEPEKYPFLYKCLYGILMLLPQSSAFGTLRNRLNSVSSIGYLHVPPPSQLQQVRSAGGVAGATSAGSSGSTAKVIGRLSGATNSAIGNSIYDVKWPDLVKKFQQVQQKHQDVRNRTATIHGLAYGIGNGTGVGISSTELNINDDRSSSMRSRGSMSSPSTFMESSVHVPVGMTDNYLSDSMGGSSTGSVANGRKGRATAPGRASGGSGLPSVTNRYLKAGGVAPNASVASSNSSTSSTISGSSSVRPSPLGGGSRRAGPVRARGPASGPPTSSQLLGSVLGGNYSEDGSSRGPGTYGRAGPAGGSLRPGARGSGRV